MKKIIFAFSIILTFVITTNTAFALTYDAPIIISNPAHKPEDFFGYSVSLSGNKIVSTAIQNNTDSLNDGTAYLFDANTGSYLRQFKNPFPTFNGYFGRSSSMSGDRVLIGALYADTGNGRAGAAYLFNATDGSLIKTIPNPKPSTNALFGTSVSSTDKYLLVGAIGINNGTLSDVGEAYLFNATNGNYLRTIPNPVPKDTAQFGYKVFVLGDLLLIGNFDSAVSGSTYLFNATDGSLLRTFTAPTPQNFDLFGHSLGIFGNKIWVGSAGFFQSSGSGQVYLFDSITGNLLDTIPSPAPTYGDFFGQTSQYNDDLFLIGAPRQYNENGAVYLFNSTNGELIQTFGNVTSFSQHQFGNAISLYDKRFAVGVEQDNSTGQNSGAVYLYTPSTTVSGKVFTDTNGDGIQGIGESGIADRTVILVDGVGNRLADKTTNVNGTYNFTGVVPGTLLVQTAPVPTNHLPSTGFHSYARPTIAAGSSSIVNFPMTPITLPNRATVNGTVFEDTNNNGVQNPGEPGLPNVQVFVVDFLTLTQTTVLTNANGVYTATGILPDVVLIQAAPIPAGHLPHTTTYSYQTLPQGSTTTVNFALKPVTLPEQGTIIVSVFNDVNSNGIRDITETGVSGATVFTFELLTAQANVQVTGLSGATTHSGLIPDVVLAQINAAILPPGFTTITTANGGFEFVPVTPGSTTTVKIGLH